jgi:hypothetical protein
MNNVFPILQRRDPQSPRKGSRKLIVLKKLRVYCVRNSEAMVLFLSKEYLDRNKTFFAMLPTQFIPDFFIAETYGLRNTIFWGVLGSRLCNIKCRTVNPNPHCFIALTKATACG